MTRRVPILPLRNAVLFPGSTPTYHIGRTRSLHLARALSPGDTLAVFTQKDSRTVEVEEGDDVYEVGTLARVTSIAPAPKDQLVISVEGTARVRLEKITSLDPHLEADVVPLEEYVGTDEAIVAARRLAKDVLSAIGVEIELDEKDPGGFADRVSSTLELPLEDKIELLAETDVAARLSLLAQRAADAYAKEDRDGTKKERVLHTRVPAVLERELKRLAESLRVPVSNLVRAVLEDAVDVADKAGENVESRLKRFAKNLEDERDRLKRRVQRDPLSDVFAFQPVKLAVAAICAKCETKLERGTTANLGLTDKPRPANERVFVCDACIPNE